MAFDKENNAFTDDSADLDSKKRLFVNSLENERGRKKRSASPKVMPINTTPVSPANENLEIARLTKELRQSQMTITLLEEELYRIEQTALEAIAETGAMRKKLSQQQPEESHPTSFAEAINFSDSLLTEALHGSEREIARLCKDVDLLTRKCG